MLPFVCMPSWLSVVTTALGLTVLLVCFSLERTLFLVDQYVSMGCQSCPACHGTSYSPTYKAAACQYVRSRPCNQSNRGIRLVTIQSSPRLPVTRILEGLVPLVHGHQLVQTRRSQVCDTYKSGYISPLPHHTFSVPDHWHTFFQEYHTLFRYILLYITKNRLYM